MGKRLVTLVTCQWSDLPFEELCKTAKQMGYDGLELAVWGNAFDLDKAYKTLGMNINIVTSAKTVDECKALLLELNFPLK